MALILPLLACVLLRQPVTPYDLLRLAMDGQLPYLNAAQQCVAAALTLPRPWHETSFHCLPCHPCSPALPCQPCSPCPTTGPIIYL